MPLLSDNAFAIQELNELGTQTQKPQTSDARIGPFSFFQTDSNPTLRQCVHAHRASIDHDATVFPRTYSIRQHTGHKALT